MKGTCRLGTVRLCDFPKAFAQSFGWIKTQQCSKYISVLLHFNPVIRHKPSKNTCQPL